MPHATRLVATAPMGAPPELRALAEDVFTAVSRARFVSVESLMAYAGPDGLTLELLGAWCRVGLLTRAEVHPDPLKPESIEYVALTTEGARTLEAATGRAAGGMTPARLKRSSQKRAHDVFVGEVALAVLALAKEKQIDLIGVETDDKKLANVIFVCEFGKEPERIVLQPDALVVTNGSRGKEALLVEVDRGSIAPGKMATRYRGYLAWYRSDGPGRHVGTRALRVLTLVPTVARLERLHRAAFDANGGKRSGFLAFGLLGDFTVANAERLFGPIVRPLGADANSRVSAVTAAPAARAA
jgi:hypothetical protein